MEVSERAQDFKRLNAQLSSRHEDQRAESIHRRPPLSVKALNDRDKVCKCLTGPSSGAADQISSSERMWNRSSLDFGHPDEFRFEETSDRCATAGKIRKPDLNQTFVVGLHHLARCHFCVLFSTLLVGLKLVIEGTDRWGFLFNSFLQLLNFVLLVLPFRHAFRVILLMLLGLIRAKSRFDLFTFALLLFLVFLVFHLFPHI